MKIKQLSAVILLASALITLSSCEENAPKVKEPQNAQESAIVNIDPETASEIPAAYLTPMTTLLSEWGVRKGSMSDPLIGTRILMYEKTKDEVGYAILDIDGDGVQDMITAPIDNFKLNGMVYDILTIKDGTAWHLANSLSATYHFMSDGIFILRTPSENNTANYKHVKLNGVQRPTETPITESEASKYTPASLELTPFSSLEK